MYDSDLFEAFLKLRLPDIENGEELYHLIHKAYFTFMRAKMDISSNPISTEELIRLERVAAHIELVASLAEDMEESARDDAFYIAAMIHEFLGDSVKENSEHSVSVPSEFSNLFYSTKWGHYCQAAILYSLGKYEANSVVMAKRVLEKLPVSIEENLMVKLFNSCFLTIITMLSRDFHATIESAYGALTLLRDIRDKKQGDVEIDFVWLKAIDPLLDMVHGCLMQAQFMLYGDAALSSRAKEFFDDAEQRAKQLSDSFAYWIATHISSIASQMSKRSIYSVQSLNTSPRDYLRHLAQAGKGELWTSQIEALSMGFLDSFYSVVNMPTSSGKSLLAELKIVNELRDDGFAVYVVPTLALVSQVVHELRERLSLLSIPVRIFVGELNAEYDVMFDEEEKEFGQGGVSVVTPEKLDLHMRFNPGIFRECRLFLFDEAHNVGDKSRGWRIESLITRIKLECPESRIVLLSAMLPNVDEFVKWLGEDKTMPVNINWRPTRLLKGLCVLTTEDNSLPSKSGVQANDKIGIVFAYRPKKLSIKDIREVTLPALVEAKQNQSGKPDNTTHACDLIPRLLELSDSVLVFFPMKGSERALAKRLAKKYPNVLLPAELNREIQRIQDEIGGTHDVFDYMEKGIAFHHADLPAPIRKLVEDAFRNRSLKVLAATGTLMHGVNTPATTVLFVGDRRRHGEKWEYIAVSEFQNAAGRAGRALIETQGQAILLSSAIFRGPRAIREQYNKYLFPDADTLKVKSVLEEMEKVFLQATFQDIQNTLNLDEMLMLAYSTILHSEDELSRFYENTLSALDKPKERCIRLGRQTSAYIQKLMETKNINEQRIAAYAKTGASTSACNLIYSELEKLWEQKRDEILGLSFIPLTPVEWLFELAPIVLSTDYFELSQPQQKYQPQNITEHVEVLSAWIRGDTLHQIAKLRCFSRSVSQRANPLDNAVQYTRQKVNKFSWAFGICYLFLKNLWENTQSAESYFGIFDEEELPEVCQEIGLLPLYVRFGVDSPIAVSLCLEGLSSRYAAHRLARKLADRFPLFDRKFSSALNAVRQWKKSVTFAEILELFEGNEIWANFVAKEFGKMEKKSNQRLSQVKIVDVQEFFKGPIEKQPAPGDLLYFDIKPKMAGRRGWIQANSMFFGPVGILEDGEIDDKLFSHHAQNETFLYGTVVQAEKEGNHVISLTAQLH